MVRIEISFIDSLKGASLSQSLLPSKSEEVSYINVPWLMNPEAMKKIHAKVIELSRTIDEVLTNQPESNNSEQNVKQDLRTLLIDKFSRILSQAHHICD